MSEPRNIWRAVKSAPGTIFDSINSNFASTPNVVPSLRDSKAIIIGSDYSGESKEEPYVVYSFLLVGSNDIQEWDQNREVLRSTIFPDNRRMSYKALGEKLRRRFLAPILESADNLEGLSFTLAIDKNCKSIFDNDYPLDTTRPDFENFRNWKPSVLEKAFTILHTISFLIAGIGHPNQDIFWFTDDDQIAANPRMLTWLTKAFSWIVSDYVDFDLGHLRCGTTSCDNGTRQIEDLVCIPDLIAGALSEQFRASVLNGVADDRTLWLSGPGMREKAPPILWWLAGGRAKLKKHVIVINPVGDSHKVSWFNYTGVA